ncbi:hypothetical protein G6F70_005919 [Rhizopus microsporus]|nr:hypothetical protein G6F71_005865 [Rhizopus microsporus]KAG1198309.1 hypothetical protein G6F70_005919 [Rhizopus microsporus]KAG1210012.1 hypothetical protein G6F69_005847 [Rhizopus microsporus]KAG1230221.1 hypothetical protein G6F67_006618 [Rhizopus microsporus]KAG1262275.1 hypothetical protein G6F68_006045 [Rhizopus microsporus]
MASTKAILYCKRGDEEEEKEEDTMMNMIDKPDDSGKKPDFMIGSRPKKKEFYFFFVEIKRSDITSKHRAEDEFTKILKQMKDSADKALCLGVKGPVSLGLLVEDIF